MRQLQFTSAGGFAAALVAVVASCCALPMALAFAGVSTSVIGVLGPLHTARPIILGLATLLLGAGWAMAVRRRSTRAYPLLATATALLILALAWQVWDPVLEHLVMRTTQP